LLPELASGVRRGTLAITELNGQWAPHSIKLVATSAANGYRLDGTKSYVVDGHLADLLVVAARLPDTIGSEGLALFTLDAKTSGVERHLLESMDTTRKLARIEFHGVPHSRSAT